MIVVDRAARTENGVGLLVQLAEALQARVIDMGGRVTFPKTHHLGAPVTAVNNADVIIGMEVSDFWGVVNSYIDNGEHGIGINRSKIRSDTKLISISSVELNTKANYQDFQRFQSVDVSMAADAEATLPALIEAVKSAISNDHKAEIERRGEAAKKARAEGRARTLQLAALAWDASPISTARLVMETVGPDQEPRLVACFIVRQRQQLAQSAVADREVPSLARRVRRLWRWLWRSGLDWSGARQPRSRSVLGQHSVGR